MKWEKDILPVLDRRSLKYWAGHDCETALVNWVDSYPASTLAMMFRHINGTRQDCVWYIEAEDSKGPYDGSWLAWSGEVPKDPCSYEWLQRVLLDIRQFDSLEELSFDQSTPKGKQVLRDFKTRWPLIYGMDYHQPWLISFCKSIGKLPMTKPNKYAHGWQTQSGADLDTARTLAPQLIEDTAVLALAAKHRLEPV